MKKLVNLIALVMLMSTNVLTPFSYAQVEIPEVIPENEMENVVEDGEIPEISEETLDLDPEEKGEIEQEKQEDETAEKVLSDTQDDIETSVTDETEKMDTVSNEGDEIVQSMEEISEVEVQDENLEGGEAEDDFSLQKVDEFITMEVIPNTSVTLLPGTGFNETIKRLAGGSGATYNSGNSTITQIVQTGNIPEGVITGEISEPDSEYPVYAWFTGGIIYYTSEAETIYMNSDSSSMFYHMQGLTGLDLNKLNTSRVTNMKGMFAGCTNLANLNLSGWDTSNVTSMNFMFNGCTSLTDLDLSSWDTSNVTFMESMFDGCSKLENLDLSNWNTNKVTNINFIFYNCNKLNQLNLSGWNFSNLSLSSYNPFYYLTIKRLDLSNATFSGSMYDVFYNMTNLEEINLSGADMSNVTNMSYMFYNCRNLVDIKGLDTWDTSNVTNMQYMFYNESSLTSLDLSSFDTSNVTTMNSMFYGCTNLTELNLDGWNFSKINSYYNYPFHNNSTIKRLSLSNAIFSGSMYEVFYNMINLEEINLEGVDTSKVTDMNHMFYNNSKLVDIRGLDALDTSNVINMSSMFAGCSSLTGIDLSNFNTSNVINMYDMFQNCTGLINLNLDGWDLSKNPSMGSSISNTPTLKQISMSGRKIPVNFTHVMCRNWGGPNDSIEEIDVSEWDLSQTKNLEGLFGDCRNLKIIKGLDTWDTSKVTDMNSMFYNCRNLTGLDLSNFDTSNVTNISSIFGYCTGLEQLNLSGWDLSKVQYVHASYWGWNDTNMPLKKLNMTNATFSGSMHEVFYNMTNLEELILDGVDTSNVINMNGMFRYSDKLTNLDLTSFDTSKVTDMNNMFNYCTGLMELDLSSFDTSEVTNMGRMFYNTPNLKTIYASDNFVTTALTGYYSSGSNMFYNSVNLIGGNGTKFDSGYIDKTYAKIDKVGQTGYFTDKNAITVKFINTLDGTETVATFAKGQKLTPPYVDRYHVVGGYLDEAMIQPIDLKKGVDAYSVIYVKYERNGSSGGGGGGGSSKDTDKDTHGSAEDSQKDSEENAGKEISPVSPLTEGGLEQPEGQTGSQQPLSPMDSFPDREQTVTPLIGGDGEARGGGTQSYSPEFQQAYKFAHENGITTKDTIQSAQMNGKLTRIAMAKMLSQYAINVLGQTPDTSKTIKFKDVSNKKDADYDNGVTLAYQLGIMGQNMPGNKFRPNDEVSRAEFATALSRLLYQTTDGKYKSTKEYYIPHMAKLYNEGIISNTDPSMAERRGYVMIMLMRSAK